MPTSTPLVSPSSATMTDDALLVQSLAAILECLASVQLDSAYLCLSISVSSSRDLLAGGCCFSYVVRGLESHASATDRRLVVHQTSVDRVHTDAVVGLQLPAAGSQAPVR